MNLKEVPSLQKKSENQKNTRKKTEGYPPQSNRNSTCSFKKRMPTEFSVATFEVARQP